MVLMNCGTWIENIWSVKIWYEEKEDKRWKRLHAGKILKKTRWM